jgi:copper chaperone
MFLKYAFTLIAFLCVSFTISNLHAQAANTSEELVVSDVRVLKLVVEGMTCQKGCADGIDKKLKETAGIQRSKTLLETGICRIVYDPNVLTPRKIMAMVEEMGYKVAMTD